MKKIIIICMLSAILLVLLLGCDLLRTPDIESWDHVVSADNYSVDGGEYTYTYEDDRFNQTDWFDIYMDNSYWEAGLGWGPFEDVFDTGVFYYSPIYYDGYVEWTTYGEDIVGATLRFYRIPDSGQ